jgi:hypothetical protein
MDINISSSGGGHVLLWSPEKLPDCILNHPKVNINVCNSVGTGILNLLYLVITIF